MKAPTALILCCLCIGACQLVPHHRQARHRDYYVPPKPDYTQQLADTEHKLEDAEFLFGVCVRQYGSDHAVPALTASDVADAAITSCNQVLDKCKDAMSEWTSYLYLQQGQNPGAASRIDVINEGIRSLLVSSRSLAIQAFVETLAPAKKVPKK